MKRLPISSVLVALMSLIATPAMAQGVPAKPGTPVAAQRITIGGSPAGHAISQGAVDAWRKYKPGASITDPGIVGTAVSFAALCGGSAEVIHVSRPIQKAEMEACAQARVEFIELPIAFDAVTLVTNAKNTFLDRLSVDDLRKLWSAAAEGKVTRWNEVNPRWPATPIRLLGPDPQSDETHYFTDAVLGAGQPSRKDYTGSIDMNLIVQSLARDTGSLAYVPLAYYLGNTQRLRAVPIVAPGGGTAVAPTADNVARGLYQPLSRPLFLYVNAQSLSRPPVREFVEYYVTNGAQFARRANYVPLAEASYQAGLSSLRNLTKGTAWNGTVPIGLTLDTLQKKQATL